MTARQDAAQVLAAHALMPFNGRGAWSCACSPPGDPDGVVVFPDRDQADLHQADALAAAGLLVTPEHDAQVAARAWGEGCAAGLSTGLDIADLRSGPVDLTKVPPPPTNPYRIERQEDAP